MCEIVLVLVYVDFIICVFVSVCISVRVFPFLSLSNSHKPVQLASLEGPYTCVSCTPGFKKEETKERMHDERQINEGVAQLLSQSESISRASGYAFKMIRMRASCIR